MWQINDMYYSLPNKLWLLISWLDAAHLRPWPEYCCVVVDCICQLIVVFNAILPAALERGKKKEGFRCGCGSSSSIDLLAGNDNRKGIEDGIYRWPFRGLILIH